MREILPGWKVRPRKPFHEMPKAHKWVQGSTYLLPLCTHGMGAEPEALLEPIYLTNAWTKCTLCFNIAETLGVGTE